MTSLFGHIEQQKWLIAMLKEHRLHHGLILAGRQGLGKYLYARHAAIAILSQDMAAHDGGEKGSAQLSELANEQIAKMVFEDRHPDVQIIKRGPKNKTEASKAERGAPFERGRNIKVDQIRDLQRRFATRPTLGHHRIIILDSADDLERGAANALLKSLEEPSEHTHFFLISHNPGKLLPTIRSRCQLLRFEPLNAADMSQFLQSTHSNLDHAQIQAALDNSNGIPGDVIALADNKQNELMAIAQQIIDHGDHDHRLRLLLAKGIARMKMDDSLRIMRRFPPLLAEYARSVEGRSRQAALDSWSAVRALLDSAPTYNYDMQALIFHIAGLLAEPARIRTAKS